MTAATRPILVTQRTGLLYVVRWSNGNLTPITSRRTVDTLAHDAGLVVDWQHPTQISDGRTAWTLTPKEDQ